MSTDAGNSSAAWHSNGSYPAQTDTEPLLAEQEKRPDVPTPEERVHGILDEYPDRVLRRVSEKHGRKLREEALEDAETVEREVETGESETMVVSDEVERSARTWLDVLDRFLEDYESYRDTKLRMARGRSDKGDREEFLVDLHNSFSPEYQSTQYARLKALKRMLIGESAEESPTGEEYPGEFEEPVTVLFGLTASSTPEGEYAPVVDQDREIREAWSGSDGVRRTLRYVLQDKLGLDSSQYAWWWQSEPHPGGGEASAYSHSHPVVILDAAAADLQLGDLDAEVFRPVVAKHLAECEAAGPEAHRLADAVTVREPGEIQDFASYVSEYLSIDPDEDLLERSDEYLLWAASQWASTTQKYSKSRTATAAIDADRCHQQYADAEAGQDHDHGEKVVRSERPGVEYECAACGSEFRVSQSPDTLVEARRVAADGGAVAVGDAEAGVERSVVSFDHSEVEKVPAVSSAEVDGEGGVPSTLRGRWPSADEAASIGSPTTVRECDHEERGTCPLCCEEGETVDASVPIPEGAVPAEATVERREVVGRVPQWEPEAVVREWSGEETVISEPGGTAYGEIVVEGVDAIPAEKLIPPDRLRTPEPDVDPTEYPPPELIERQLSEIHHGERITAKQWSEDWHAERYGAGSEEPEGEAVPWSEVLEFREENPSATVSEVAEEVGVPTSELTLVGGVIGPPS